MSATQLIARPGTLPTIDIPVVRGRVPDVDGVWSHLREPADFFGISMPTHAELAAALARFTADVFDTGSLAAATVTIVEGPSRVVVSGFEVRPVLRRDAVRIEASDAPHVHRATDPWWLRMAARTTSRAAEDQLARWLTARGVVDGLSDGVPLRGALVFETADGPVGVENPEPTSVLDQLTECGVIAEIARASACPLRAEWTWWVSPLFDVHPVTELAGVRTAVEPGGLPSFARWT